MATQNDLLLKAILDITDVAKKADEIVAIFRTRGKLAAEAFGVAMRDSTKAAAATTGNAQADIAGARAASEERRRLAREEAEEIRRQKKAAADAEKAAAKEKAAGQGAPSGAPSGGPAPSGGASNFAAIRKEAEIALQKQKEVLASLALNGAKNTEEYSRAKAKVVEYARDLKKVEDAARSAGIQVKNMSNAESFNRFNALAVISGVQRLAGALQSVQGPFIELDKQIKNIGTLGVQEAGQSLDKFQSQIVGLSKTVPDSAANIANGVYNAISAGIQGTEEQIVDFVATASKAAVAGLSDTNTSVDVLTSVVNAYGVGAAGAKRVSNELFAAVKLGKTTFRELAGTTATMVPIAAAAGVSFGELTAGIAQMTANGVPTRRAANALRASIVAIIKPTKQMREVFAEMGLTTEQVTAKLKNQGLIATIREIDTAAKASGRSTIKTFGNINAATAALLLAGEKGKQAAGVYAQLQKEVAAGVADKAFGVAAQSIDVRVRVLLNNVQAIFSGAFNAIGSTANVAISSLNQLAPTLTVFSQAKNLLPTGAFAKFGEAIGANGGGVVGAFRTLGQAAAGIGGQIATMGKAFGAFLLSPVGIVLALAAAIYVIYENVAEVRAAVAGFAAFFSSIFGGLGDFVSDIFSGANIVETISNLFSDAGLAANNAFQTTLNAEQLKAAISELGDALDEALTRKQRGEGATAVQELLDKYNSATDEIQKQALAQAISEQMPGAVRIIEEFNEKTGRVEKTYQLNTEAAQRFLDKTKEEAGTPDLKGAVDILNGLKAQAQQLDQNKEKVKALEAELAARKAVSADTAGVTADLDSAKKAAEESQKAFAASYKQANDLNVFDGVDQVTEADHNLTFKSFIGLESQIQTTTTNVKTELAALQAAQSDTLAAMETEARSVGLGEALTEGAKISGQIGGVEQIDELLAKLAGAKDDVEKANIISAIASAVPESVSAFDENNQAIAINVDQVKAYTSAMKTGFSGDLQKQQEKFAKGFKDQAEGLAETKAKASGYIAELIALNKAGKGNSDQASELRGKIEETNGAIRTQTTELKNTVKQGREFGFVKGDVQQVGAAFGLSAQAARGVADAEQVIVEGAEDAADAAGSIGAAFLKARAEAQSAAGEMVADAAALVLALRDKSLAKEEREAKEKQLAELRANARDQIILEKDFGAILEAEEIKAGKREAKKPERKKRIGKDLSGLSRQEAIDAARNANRLAEIDNQYLRDITAAQFAIVARQRKYSNELAQIAEERAAARTIENEKERAAALTALTRRESDAAKLFAVEKSGLENALQSTIEKGRATIGKDILSTTDEAVKLALDSRAKLNEALTPIEGTADLETIRDQGEERLAILEAQGEAAILAAVSSSTQFAKATAEGTKVESEALRAANLILITEQQKFADERERVDAERAKQGRSAITDDEAAADPTLAPLQAAAKVAEGAVAEVNKTIVAAVSKTRADLADQYRGFTADQIKALTDGTEQKLAYAVLIARLDTERAVAAATIEERKKQRAADLADRLKGVKDIGEQERLTALAAVEDELAEALILYAGNDAKINEAKRAALDKRLEIERNHLAKTNKLVSLALDIRAALVAAFDRKTEKKSKEELDKKLADIRTEEAALFASYAHREIEYTAFNERLNAIADKRAEVERENGAKAESFDAQLKAAGIAASAAFENARVEANKKATDELNETLDKRDRYVQEKMDKGFDAEEARLLASVAFDKEIKEKRSAALATFSGEATASILSILAQGEGANQKLGALLFDMVTKAIPSLVSLIFGQSIATLGPILGPITAGVLTGAFIGLTQLAKSAAGFKGGGHTGSGNPNDVAGLAHKEEFYFTAEKTKKHRPLFEAIHKGMSPAAAVAKYHRPELSSLVYDPTANVVRAASPGPSSETAALASRVAAIESAVVGIPKAVGKAVAGQKPSTVNVTNIIDGERIRRNKVRKS